MKFVIAPDKYKGSLTGFQFCNAVEEGILKVFPHAQILKKPLADGGDGTLEVVKAYLGAEVITTEVHDPLFRKINATYLFSSAKKIAFIEMSEASGHRLLSPNELNAMETTTLGTGELILDAIKKGAKEILLGIGGSATNDGGMGMAQALGFSFYDSSDQQLAPIGKNLKKVNRISIPKTSVTNGVHFKIACDVNNPFYGTEGAAHVYAEQKGASKVEIEQLDQGLKNFAGVINSSLNIELQQVKGAGAAGGLGGGAIAFLNGKLISGIHLVMELAHFEDSLPESDWIITGEGKLDSQTLSGKTMSGVLEKAKKHDVPVAALCGSVELEIEQQEDLGITYATSILKNFETLEEAMSNSYQNLVFATYNFVKTIAKK